MNESLLPIFLSWLIPLAFMLLVFLLIRKRVLAWLGSPDYLADTGKATLSGFVRRGLALYIDYNLFYLPSQFLIIFIPLSAGTEKTLVGAFLVTFVLFQNSDGTFKWVHTRQTIGRFERAWTSRNSPIPDQLRSQECLTVYSCRFANQWCHPHWSET
jgi:hypothetical protein